MKTNVSLEFDAPLLLEIRALAAEKNMSITALQADSLNSPTNI